ncbi:glutamate/aspartate ABC transporter substrate-binding protein, partial [Escherichia coli]
MQTITTQTLTTGIHAFLTQKIKELDMQLRKPATAI